MGDHDSNAGAMCLTEGTPERQFGNANFGDHNNTFFIFFLQFAYSPGENGILFHTWGSRSGSEGSMASRSQL